MLACFFFQNSFSFCEKIKKAVFCSFLTGILKKCPKMPKIVGHFFVFEKMPEGFKKCPIFDLGH